MCLWTMFTGDTGAEDLPYAVYNNRYTRLYCNLFSFSPLRRQAQGGTRNSRYITAGFKLAGRGAECRGVCPGKPEEIAVLFVPIGKPWESGP